MLSFTGTRVLIVTLVLSSLVGCSSLSRTTTKFTTSKCATLYGTSKGPSPIPRTTSRTITHSHVLLTTTITPSTTVTPATTTITTTSTSTGYTTITLSTVTDSFTTIITSTQTDAPVTVSTTTETGTTTSTTTTTVNVATTTIPEAPGFTPIQSGVSGGSKRRDMSNALDPHNEKRRRLDTFAGSVRFNQAPSMYPTQIKCDNTVTYLTMTFTTVTASTTTFTAVTPSTTSTATTTSTSTITSTPADVSTTSTSTTTIYTSDTITATTTTTSTYTTTTTAYVAATTIYAVCEDSANYLAAVNNVYVAAINWYGSDAIMPTKDAHDCCVACASSYNCVFDFWDPDLGNCHLITSSECSADDQVGEYDTHGNHFYDNISNSNCGYVVFGYQF